MSITIFSREDKRVKISVGIKRRREKRPKRASTVTIVSAL